MKDDQGLYQKPGEGVSYWFGRDLYTFKAVGQQTEGTFALCEVVVQPGGGTPLHWHSRECESFYIQQGQLDFQLGERRLVAGPGDFLHSPQGQLHQFINTGEEPARMLCWVHPAGFEQFIAEAGEAAGTNLEVQAAPSPQPDLEKVLAAAARHGIEIVPPPEASASG